LKLTDNWEEECCQSNRATLGGGVRRFDDLNITDLFSENRDDNAAQYCKKRIALNSCCICYAQTVGRFIMSLASVQTFFSTHAPDIEVIITEASSATVALAAEAHGVEPDQIAKTICVKAGEEIVLVVAAGMSRLDNKKFRERFGAKPRMLGAEDVVEVTSHPVGGVCPFGLPSELPIYCDESLRKYDEVVPAAGATNSAVRISPTRMVELTNASWVDVCQ
jgi:prolyl-tRNA editing enzyme YbaK/EbsC (Cys-tRNA(Pro) deacylase)